MKANKLLINIGLPLIALSISACSFSSSSKATVNGEEKTISRMITPDYGLHVQDHVSLLFGTANIPFKPSDFGIDKIVAGDQLEINYQGEFLEYQTYPSSIDTSKMHVTSMKLYESRIAEYEVTVESGAKTLEPTEEFKGYRMISAEYVIYEDGTFATKEKFLETAEADTKVYGSNPAAFNSLNVTTLFSYNPRP